MLELERDENLPEPLNQEESMVTGGDQDLHANSENPRDRANRLRRERRANLSAAKKDAAAQFQQNQESTWNRSAINNHLNQNNKKPPL